MLRLDNDAGSGIHFTPTGVEFDERRMALGNSTEVRLHCCLFFLLLVHRLWSGNLCGLCLHSCCMQPATCLLCTSHAAPAALAELLASISQHTKKQYRNTLLLTACHLLKPCMCCFAILAAVQLRAGATLRFPRSLPVDRDDPNAFKLQVHRLSLKTLW